MGTLLVIVVLVLVVWVIGRARRKSTVTTVTPSVGKVSVEERVSPVTESAFRAEIDNAVRRDYGSTTSKPDLRRVEAKPKKDHAPRPPVGPGVAAWSPRTQQLEVAGEWYRADNLRTLFRRHARVTEAGTETRLPAVLVPDPSNPYDKHAVAVFVDDLHVGYMERADARVFHAPIASLPGGELTVPSRQWLRGTSKHTWARVTLSIPKPEHLECPNPVDADDVLLPPGATVQVTREEDYMEHLSPLLQRYGSETVLRASLRTVVEQRPRSTVELVAVDIDGKQVGVLSPTQTANFLALVRRAEAEGRALTCRATLRGNSLKADVALHTCKAHELDDRQLEGLFARQGG